MQLITEPVNGAATQASLAMGDYTTRSFELATTQPTTTGGSVQLLGRTFATNGYRLVGRERRGPIDIAASSNHSWLGLRARQPIGSDLEVTLTGRAYTEERGNGTPYQNNSSREKFASAAIAGKSGAAPDQQGNSHGRGHKWRWQRTAARIWWARSAATGVSPAAM